MSKDNMAQATDMKEFLINDIISVCKRNGVSPARDWYLRNADPAIEPWHIGRYFGTWKALLKAIRMRAPEVFDAFPPETAFVKRVNAPDIEIETSAKDIIVTFHSGGEVIDKNALGALTNLAKNTKAKLYILWGREETGVMTSLEELKEYRHNICTSLILALDKYTRVYDPLKVFNHSNPLTNYLNHLQGLNKVVLGSPIQVMKSAPRDFEAKIYREMWTTGTIDKLVLPKTELGLLNNYRVKQGAVRLTYNPKLGAYDIRNIQIVDGWVYDLGKKYSSTKIEKATVEALNAGDLHLPNIDEGMITHLLKSCKQLKPENLVLHDVLDFAALNHHICNEPHLMARSLLGRPISASEEFALAKDQMRILLDGLPKSTKVYVAKSNHDDFFYKRFAKKGVDGLRRDDIVLLHKAMISYTETGFFSPLVDLEKEYSNFHLLRPQFTEITNGRPATKLAESIITKSGFTMHIHGDRGINGARGTLRSLKNTYSFISSGHSHSVEFEGNAASAGMLGRLNQGYNSGQPLTWEHGYVILYENGAFQIVTFEDE